MILEAYGSCSLCCQSKTQSIETIDPTIEAKLKDLEWFLTAVLPEQNN